MVTRAGGSADALGIVLRQLSDLAWSRSARTAGRAVPLCQAVDRFPVMWDSGFS